MLLIQIQSVDQNYTKIISI